VKWGDQDKVIPVEVTDVDAVHMANFLDCVRTRQTPTLDVETGFRVQVAITMAVQAYREGRVLYWDSEKQVVTPKAPKA
jgi:hypothetical protein